MSSGRYKPRVPFVTSLLRYNVSAATATATDYSVLALCTEILGFDPVLSTFIGAIAGGTVAFLLGRNWTFLNKEGNISAQGIKFLVVVGGSILLSEYVITFRCRDTLCSDEFEEEVAFHSESFCRSRI